MFKALVLQYLFNLNSDQTEFKIQDCYSFCRFPGLSPEGQVPDARTVWMYCERLKERGFVDKLFSELLIQIDAAGFARKGQIADAAIIPVPKRRNTREENRQIRDGAALKHGVITNAAKRMLKPAGLRSMVKSTMGTKTTSA